MRPKNFEITEGSRYPGYEMMRVIIFTVFFFVSAGIISVISAKANAPIYKQSRQMLLA